MAAPESRINTTVIASAWLSSFSSVITLQEKCKESDIKSLFNPNGWLRDALALSWDMHSIRGHGAIATYISTALKGSAGGGGPGKNLDPKSFVLDEELLPSKEDALDIVTPNGDIGIEFGFKFKGDIVIGRGYVRLLWHGEREVELQEDQMSWKALTVFLSAVDLVGYEEEGPEEGTYDGHSLAWKDVRARRMSEVEDAPDVIIVGAGHCGLNLAAVMKQNGLKALLVDKHERIGDSWRKRYPTLSLHTVRSYSSFKYQDYPRTWPIYAPRDKLADWMEHYARSQDLCIWTRSTILPKPTYNLFERRWEVYVNHAGSIVKRYPKHLVIATGPVHKPVIPDIPGRQDVFKGLSFHAMMYGGAGDGAFAGKNVVVIGAGNSSADICQDLYTNIAPTGGTVTMVQRSATCVVSRDTVQKKLLHVWPDPYFNGNGSQVDVGLCDFRNASLPFALLREWEIAHIDDAWKAGEDIYDGLRKVGFNLTMGKDNEGQLIMVFERGGGYWLDVGCAELVSSSKVKLKHGTEVERFTPEGLQFKDGSNIPADVVIFATGYQNGRASLDELFSPDILRHVCAVGGVDEEGEAKGVYRPCGYPGLWFAIGDFGKARATAKQLTLLIQSVNLGLLRQELPAS